MNKSFKFFGFLYLLFAPLVVQAELFNADEFRLSNGLRCIVVQNHKAPVIKHMLWYNVGAVDEQVGKGGVAHLLEHLMFRGTKNFPDGEFNNIMHKHGVESNAFTSHDFTVYHQFADISKLEALMRMEADRMQNLSFTDEAFMAERNIVFQERKQVVENNPLTVANERLRLSLWGNSPYAHPVTGHNEEIENLTKQDVMEFYQRYYAPNNAILILAGDIDIKTAEKLVKKYYGSIPEREIQRENIGKEKGIIKQSMEINIPDIEKTRIVYKFLLPNFSEIKDKIYSYDVLAQYLGNGKTSYMYKDLVVNKGIAEQVSVFSSCTKSSNCLFTVNIVPAENVSLDELQDTVKTSISNALNEFDLDKLNLVKKKLVSSLIFANDNPEDAAYTIGYLLTLGFSLSDIQNCEESIMAINLSDILMAYEQIFENTSRIKAIIMGQNNE